MVNLNPCGGVGIVFAVAAAAVSFVQVTRREFVEVFIPTDVDNKGSGILTLSCAIAGLGVYTTEYNSSCLDEYTLLNSRVPAEVFESPTTEFKLLFPAQQNFVAEVLPINRALITQLDSALPAPVASTILLEDVEKIEEIGFENCEQYVDDAKTNLDSLFLKVNNELLPQMIPLLVGESVPNIIVALTAVNTSFATLTRGLVIGTFDLAKNFLPGFEAECPNITVLEINSAATAEEFICLAKAYKFLAGGLSQLPLGNIHKLLLSGIGDHLNNSCAEIAQNDTEFEILSCLENINVQLLDTNLYGPPQFLSDTGATATLCDIFTECTQGKLGLLGLVTGVVTNVTNLLTTLGQPVPSGLIQILPALEVNIAVGVVFSPEISLTDGTTQSVITVLSKANTAQPFPSSFTAFYVPCGMLQLAVLQNGAIPNVPALNETCSFDKFFAAASSAAQSVRPAFVPILEQLVVLYGRCKLAGLGPINCGPFFTGLFLNGAYSFGLDATDVFNSAKSACQDDEIDIEKITAAQTLLGAAVAVYILSVLVGVAGMILSVFSKPVFGVAAGLSFLALVLNIVALLQVRSAPVYGSVGQPSVLFRPKYIEGSVVTLATVSVGLSVAAGVSYLVAVCIQGKGSKAAAVDEADKKAVVVEAEEVKQTV